MTKPILTPLTVAFFANMVIGMFFTYREKVDFHTIMQKVDKKIEMIENRMSQETGSSSTSDADTNTTSDEGLSDEERLNESICRRAEENNISVNMAKDIIKTLVSNDQVIAICKLRAEEIERHKEEGKQNFKKQLLYDSPDGLKMTRNKARELNHSISSSMPALDLKAIEPDEDVFQLVQAELHEEEGDATDGEYDPNDDEADLSDDYSTATCSDVESQPRTPGDALAMSEADDSPTKVQYDEEGVFKVPGEPRSPKKAGEVEVVAGRTRSKVSLTTTPIETIQEQFIHPDIGPDTYEALPSEVAEDEPWAEFLHQFQNPLGDDKEKEDDNDPDYVAKASQPAGDDYDMRVSKREVQVLIDELLEGFEESFNPDFPNDLEIETLKASFCLPPTSVVNIPVASKSIRDSVSHNVEAMNQSFSDVNQSQGHYYYQSATTTGHEAADVDYNTYIEPLAILNAGPTFDDHNYNMILGSDNKLYLMLRANGEGVAGDAAVQAMETDDCETYVGAWSRSSIQILHRQLLVHIQLAGQFYTQCYSHPEIWQKAGGFLDMIEELAELVSRESAPFLSVLCWNLRDMQRICRDWRAELDVENEENLKYVAELVAVEKKQRRRFFAGRLAELWVTNRAFMFHQYLPKSVAHCGSAGVKLLNDSAEMRLFLLSVIECASEGMTTKKVRRAAAEYFARRYNGTRTADSLLFATNGRRRSEGNPIVAYFETGQVPAIEHEELGFDCYEEVAIHADRAKYTLPIRWNAYVHGRARWSRIAAAREGRAEAKSTAPVDVPRRKIKAHKRSIAVSSGEVKALKRLIERVRGQESRCLGLEAIRRRKALTKKLHNLLQATEDEYDGRMKILCANSISSKIFFYIKEFDLFVRLLTKRLHSDMSWMGHGEENRRACGRVNANDHHSAFRARGVSKEDSLFAWSFIGQVKERLMKRKAKGSLDDVWDILQRLELKEHGVEDFYSNLEEKFLNHYPDLVLTFIEYLLPCHALQIGKFFHRLINSSHETFRGHLAIYVDKQREQLSAVYSVLNELSGGEGVSMSEIKGRFQVILHGNPLIESWFLQLFPRMQEDQADFADDYSGGSLVSDRFMLIPANLIGSLERGRRDE